jgi:type IV pilus assembly protein PilW
MGLIELMVTMLISILMMMGLFSIVYGTRGNFLAQNQLAQLQDSERLAMNLITNIVQTGGYFPNPTVSSYLMALPAGTINNGVFTAGQAIYGATPASTGDQLYVRYVAGTSDGVLDCNGQSNPSATTAQTDVNLFYVSGNQLYCQVTVNGVVGTAQPLVSGVTGMSILYGVATNGGISVNQYISAANMTASNWSSVISVQVTLTFANVLTGTMAPGAGTPAAPVLTRTIDVLNRV